MSTTVKETLDKSVQFCTLDTHKKVLSDIMGQTLSEPITAKDTAVVRNSAYRVGSSCMQGWRINMEDSHTHILSMPDDPATAFFGVYDGHGGAKISDYAGKHLHKYMVNQDEYRKGNVTEALKKAFIEFDRIMAEEDSLRTEQSGSTAVVVVVKDNKLYCANIGDSRAIASVKGRLEPLSYDHKPNNTEEFERITDAGGWVDCNRVNGNLALSRAFGDYSFKRDSSRAPDQQMVIALPDVIEKEVSLEWDYIVLACDGIWDVMTNKDVLYFVTESIANGLEPEEICENLMMKCLAPDCQMAGLGCDNMTVVIVVFLHGRTYEDVIAKCKNYVADHTIEPEAEPEGEEEEEDNHRNLKDNKTETAAEKEEQVAQTEETKEEKSHHCQAAEQCVSKRSAACASQTE